MNRFLKLKNLISNNKELLLGIIVGLILSSTAVFAVIKYASNNVFYRNTSSHLNATTVQAAIDELYITCTSRAYTLTADSKGGTIPTTAGWSISGSTATKPVIFNSEYGTLPIPTKGGHTFMGWFTKESGGTQIISSTKYRIAGDSTIHAHWNADTYTATFYYQSNTASGGATVASKTEQCTVSSGSSCTVDIPTEVINSGGAYNNKYVGLSTSTGNMTQAVEGSATTVTLSANTNYYSLYRTAITIAYTTSTSVATTKTVYQNQWFTSNTAMATTVLSTTTTGTSSNATAGSLVSGYSLVGFSASASTNTATWASIENLTQSDSNKAASRTVYQIENKEDTITATFYYNDNTSCGGTTVKNTNVDVERITYLRCTSTTEADTSVNTGELSIPSIVTSSKGPYNGTYVNVASSVDSMNPATVNVSTLTYYAFYRSEVTRYYAATATTASNDTLYRNEMFTSTAAMKTVLSTTSTGTTTNATPRLAVSGYDTLVGFNTSSSKNVANSGETIAELTTTCNTTVFEIDKKSENIPATFYYSSSSAGIKANGSFSGTRTTFLRPTGTTAAGTSISQGEIDISSLSSTAPYGTSLLGWGYNANSMSTTTVNTSRTAYYAIYQTSGIKINNYNGSEYSTRTDIYRNGFYGSGERYTMVLSSSANGSGNYTTVGGPNGSTWNGLSTGADSTPEYSTVSEAAASSTTTFYTVYKYLVNYNKGVNVSGIGTNMDSCNINSTSESAGTTSCPVQLPTINPNSGYTSVGWNTTSGATTGTAPGESYTLNASPTSLYANAYPTVSYNAGNGCSQASGLPSSQVKLPSTNLTLHTEIPTCSNGKTFIGWSTVSSATETSTWYDEGGTYSIEAPLTLYAQWYDVSGLEESYTPAAQSGDFSGVKVDDYSVEWEVERVYVVHNATYPPVQSGYTMKGISGFSISSSDYRPYGIDQEDIKVRDMANRSNTLAPSSSIFSKQYFSMKNRTASSYANESIEERITRLQQIREVALTYNDIQTNTVVEDDITVNGSKDLSIQLAAANSEWQPVALAGNILANATNNGINTSRTVITKLERTNYTSDKNVADYADVTLSVYGNPVNTPKVKLTLYYIVVRKKTSTSGEFTANTHSTKGASRYAALEDLNNNKGNYFPASYVKRYTRVEGSTVDVAAWSSTSVDKTISIPDGKLLGSFAHGVTNANYDGTSDGSSYSMINKNWVENVNTTQGTYHLLFYAGNALATDTAGHTQTQIYGWGHPLYVSSGTLIPSGAAQNNYTIQYVMNNGPNPSSKPASGTFDGDVYISNPNDKEITITGDINGTGATVGNATTVTQTFAGWSSNSSAGLGSNAKSGTTENPTTAWTGSTTKNTYFKDLRNSVGTVTLTANWNTVAGTLPTLSKTGYTCNWYSESSGGTALGGSGASYTPAATSDTSITAYANCNANDLNFNSQTLSSGTYYTNYLSNSFEGATNGTGNYSYTIESGAPTGATIDSANRKIAFTNTTNAGTYNVVVKATDNNTSKTKTATMTIIINPQTLTCPNSPSAKAFTGSSISSGVTCPTGSTAGGTQSAINRGTYHQTCIPDSNHQFSSTCSVDWTIKCNTTITGTIAAGNTVTYAGKSWTVVSTSGNNVNLALNEVSGEGNYSNASTAVNTFLNNNTITKDALAAQCIVNNGSRSGTDVGLRSDNYWTSSTTFYNSERRNKYERVNHYYITGFQTYRGDGHYSDFAEQKVSVPTGLIATSIIETGINSTSGTDYSINSSTGEITFTDGLKKSQVTYSDLYYYSRHFGSFMWYPSFSSSIDCTATSNRTCYKKWTRVLNDNGTFSLVDWTDNPHEVGNTWRQRIYLCGGESYGKRIFIQAYSASQFYYANEHTGTGWSGTSFSTSNAEKYNYTNTNGRFSLQLSSYDYTDASLGNAETASNGFLYRTYRFDTHVDNNGDRYCRKLQQWQAPGNLTIKLKYRPYITVKRS